MILFDVAVFAPIFYIVFVIAKRARPGRRFKTCLWLSFFITVPLLVYDAIYCGLYRGHGVAFLWKYWYLTVYYIVPWAVFPLTGWRLDRTHKTQADSLIGLGR